jgi:hypothetical protein
MAIAETRLKKKNPKTQRTVLKRFLRLEVRLDSIRGKM